MKQKKKPIKRKRKKTEKIRKKKIKKEYHAQKKIP